ncbi:MAG TPA: tetraacyldisaccharide 4'-kinase [Thermoanaerobaculia bacterium]|nr:tetraacyldisaccharide 4'-kinase [Thermoanaerobaculia bacterium]
MIEAPSPPRSPWQRLYGAAHALRCAWWAGRAAKLPRPVISVGNLHWGGTGKTPLVAALAAHLRDQGAKVAILSRGYKSRGEGVRVVSDFHGGPYLGPLVAGDEPVLLAGLVPGVAVVVAPQRAAAGRAALERLSPPPNFFLLDDGFSHLALARDLDLLVFPAADPFAGGRLPPAGRLREPLAAAARAHAALLTGSGVTVASAREVGRALERFGFRGAAFAAPTVVGAARGADRLPLPAGQRVLLVSGIARPASLRASAEEAGFEITGELTFPDHHDYPEPSLARLRRAFATAGAEAVLTTAKDLVKLRGRLKLPVAELPIESHPEPAFFTWLDQRLAAVDADEGR